jgi:hypothetical protein
MLRCKEIVYESLNGTICLEVVFRQRHFRAQKGSEAEKSDMEAVFGAGWCTRGLSRKKLEIVWAGC